LEKNGPRCVTYLRAAEEKEKKEMRVLCYAAFLRCVIDLWLARWVLLLINDDSLPIAPRALAINHKVRRFVLSSN
jgi:hypothetical protein